MRELTACEIESVNGGWSWGYGLACIGTGATLIGLGVAIVCTGGLALVPLSIAGAATAGEITLGVFALGAAAGGGVLIGSSASS